MCYLEIRNIFLKPYFLIVPILFQIQKSSFLSSLSATVQFAVSVN